MSNIEKQHGPMDPHAARPRARDGIGRQLDGVDPILEAKLVRKLDLYIIPVVMVLYLLSFLDRQVFQPNRTTRIVPRLQRGWY